ncbi:MAG: Gfo/Idh/MocA family protein [Candidatus Sumerlaeaceae bacterium]
MPEGISRRAFLKKTAVLTASIAALPHARVLGANDDIRVAVVGYRSKGMQHIGVFKHLPGVRVVALCDVDSAITAQALQKHFADGTPQPKTYTDVRKLLEDKEIDAVCIATPNHWHAPITVWACQAGKDVYVEKPCSHTVWEGAQMVKAAHKYKRIVQIGMQNRSDPGLKAAFEFLNAGKLGTIQHVRGIYYNLRQPIGKVSGPQQPPPEVDYNLWLGPAPEAPLMREKLHYDWHWQWPYGNGELGNNGVHMLDLATWLLGIQEFPSRVLSVGGRFLFDDDGQTPNTHLTWYDYKPVPVLCEIRNLPRFKGDKTSDHVLGHRFAVEVKCKDGSYVGYGPGGWVYDNDGMKVQQFVGDGGASHAQNFIDAVRARKHEMLAAKVEAGHLAAGLCHIGNISHRLGEKADGAKIHKAIEGNVMMTDAMERFHEHLLVNAVDVTQTPRILGAMLDFDNSSQRFTGERSEEANTLLTKPYRAGFEIHEQV